jgi:hypothetical protein
MARRALNPFYQHKIQDLMLNKGMDKRPMQILKYFQGKQGSQDPNIRKDYADPISMRVIEKYMAKAHRGELSLTEQRREFVYPVHMGSGEDQVPWELARYALDCVHFYTTNHNIRPSIGLTRRYAQTGSVTQEPIPMSDEQRAVQAEQLWYADLVGSTPSRERPSTEYVELYLASRAWASSDSSHLAIQRGVTQLVMPEADFGFLRYMPVFGKTYKAWQRTEEQQTESGETDTSTTYLQEEDFSWYTENILKKFPDAQ